MRTRGSSLLAMCAHFSLAQELVSERDRENSEARGGRTAHRRRHKPRGESHKGRGGRGSRSRPAHAAAAPGAGGGTKTAAPPPARRGGGKREHGRAHEAGTRAHLRAPAPRTEGPASPGALRYRRRGFRVLPPPGAGQPEEGPPPHPAVYAPPDKRGAGRLHAGAAAPRRPFVLPPTAPHPRVTVVSNGLICSPARSSSIAATPRSPGRGTRSGRRTAGCGCTAGCLAEAGSARALRTGRPRLLRRTGG